MPIAPWLVPTDVLGAIRSGSSVGLQVRQQAEAERQAQIANALAQQQAEAANAQAAERLRLAHEQLFQQAQQEQAAQQAKNEESQALLGLKQSEEMRQQSLFNQAQAFSQLAKSQVLPGGGDFTGMTPEEQGQATHVMQQRNLNELFQNAPPDVLPKLLTREIAPETAGGVSRGLMTYYAQLGADTGENILNANMPGGIDQQALGRAVNKKGGAGGIVQTRLKTAQQKNASDYSTWLSSQYPDKPKSEIDAEVKRYVSGGPGAVNAPTFIVKDATAADKLVVGLDQTFDQVQKFNEKYGAGAFEKYVGPWEGRITSVEKKFGQLGTDEKRDLQGILSSIAQVKQAFKLTNYGTALSTGEREDFKNIVETPTSNAFIPTLQSFRNTTRNLLQNTLSVYPDAPNIPPVLRERYFRSGSQSGPAGIPAPDQREVDKTYPTPRGPMKWTGTGWVKP